MTCTSMVIVIFTRHPTNYAHHSCCVSLQHGTGRCCPCKPGLLSLSINRMIVTLPEIQWNRPAQFGWIHPTPVVGIYKTTHNKTVYILLWLRSAQIFQRGIRCHHPANNNAHMCEEYHMAWILNCKPWYYLYQLWMHPWRKRPHIWRITLYTAVGSITNCVHQTQSQTHVRPGKHESLQT